jgi:hypothetical protein
MINRRTALGIIASASTIGASGVTFAKEKHKADVQLSPSNVRFWG